MPVDQPFSSVVDALAVTEIAAAKVAALGGGGEVDAGVIVAAVQREAARVDVRVVPIIAEAAILPAPRPPRPQILRDAADPGRRDRVARPRLWALVKVGAVTWA